MNEEYFLTPWEASIDALDLSFEMGTLDHTSGMRFVDGVTKKYKHKVSFAEEVGLFVGSTSDLFMSKSPHPLSVSNRTAQVLEDRPLMTPRCLLLLFLDLLIQTMFPS